MILQIISFLVLLFLLSFFRQKFVRHIFRRCFLFLNFKNGRHFKMTANIFFFKKIVKNSRIKRFQWKWIFTGSRTCCPILRPFRFAMAAILNPKWPPKYKNPSDLGKIWFPSRFYSCELISIIVFGIGSH